MMVSCDGCTHAHVNLDRLVSTDAANIHARMQFFSLRSSSLTHMADVLRNLTQQLWRGKKNRRAQPMFVMAVRATFPIFNSGTCSDAKNLLPCHNLPGEERERRRGSEGEGNLWLSV